MVNKISGRVTEARGAVLIPLVTLVAAGLVVIGAYLSGNLNPYICDGPCAAQHVEAPDTLSVSAAPTAGVATVPNVGPADGSKVAAAVRGRLGDKLLGSHVGFIALDPESGSTLARMGSGVFTPASTTKVLTAFAALASMDADTTFATRVVESAPGTIVLVGGGDPFLGVKDPKPGRYAHEATLIDLAKATAATLKTAGTRSVTLAFDDSLFAGPDVSPRWKPSYVSGNIVTPVSALWADQGVAANGIRSRNPAQSAASTLASLLGDRGITVKLGARTTAPAEAKEVARVESATLSQILEAVTQHSDNQAAEVMFRHVAVAQGRPGTFADAAAEVRKLLSAHEIDTAGLVLNDGSGLSRDNLISPLTLAQTIRVAATDPRTASLVSDLPIAGFNGSIHDRFSSSKSKPGQGVVRAKSGTLTGVHSLAGFALDADGSEIVFAVMADKTGSSGLLEAKEAIDRVAAALAACRCGP